MSNGSKLPVTAFIGAGNMAEALVLGVINAGLCPPEKITVTDINRERREKLRDAFGVNATENNRQAVSDASLVVLAVKPQVMRNVLEELKGYLKENAFVVSIAAGIPISVIEEGVGGRPRVVRVMPNTPALVDMGASAYALGRFVDESVCGVVEALLGAVGICVRMPEDKLDAVTALSGSGPAYVFFLAEIMLRAAREMGMEDGPARELTYATIEGAGRMLKKTGVSPEELRARVTSKGGTTEAAFGVLEKGGAGELLVEAILAAMHRSRELSGGG